MKTIYLVDWFNYAQRKIDRKETIDEYVDVYSKQGINFDYNDGVNTTLVLNTDIIAPYLIVVDERNQIESRWWVMDKQVNRGQQKTFYLRRDLVADYLDDFLSSTCYVEKGWIKDPNNPLIYNSESFNTNQIKTKEIELKDNLGLKWIVGYVNKNSLGYTVDKDGKATAGSIEYRSYKNQAYKPDIEVDSLSDWAYYDATVRPITTCTDISAEFKSTDLYRTEYSKYVIYARGSSRSIIPASEYKGSITEGAAGAITLDGLDVATGANQGTFRTETLKAYANRSFTFGNTMYSKTKDYYDNVIAQNGKIIYEKDTGKYYKLQLLSASVSNQSQYVSPTYNPEWYSGLKNYLKLYPHFTITNDSDYNFTMNTSWAASAKLELNEVSNEGFKVTIDGAKHNRTINEAYDVFAIPVLDRPQIFEVTDDAVPAYDWGDFMVGTYNSAFALGQELTDASTEGIDLQLLPYCPLPDSMYHKRVDGKWAITLNTSDYAVVWSTIYNLDNTPANVLFWLDRTDFSLTIPYNDDQDYGTPEKVKEINQLENYRLCAGDYSSAFEFNPAKNNGISLFEVDCKYKPFAPYIHVAPLFSGLYGRDFNDTRGLVCSNTNYSISRATDAWESYERTNLNYNNAFNREIENLEITHEKQLQQQVWSSVAGTISGGTTAGIATGTITGNPYAGIAAGAIGTMVSGLGAMADYNITKELQNEAIDYKKDLWNMSLQNIQALPNTLVATGAQNPNNKVFPLLEIYDCTEVEKEAFRNKIKWNGMTINVITDDVSQFLDSEFRYIKCQLIDFNTDQSTHFFNELSNELNKGVRIRL